VTPQPRSTHQKSSPSRSSPRHEPQLTPSATPTTFDCFAVVAPGLEGLALSEAVALGLPAVSAEGGGGIEWTGDRESVLRANLGLRIASRVVVRLARFEARSFAELERQSRRIDWARVVSPGSTIRFRVTCKKSRLYHSDAVMQRVADAVVRALPGTRAEGASGVDDDESGGGDEEREQLIVVRILRDQCTVSADTSGALLHRRGYRQATAKAPLRETIAAALLAASGWDGVAPLVDPLCGSGTIPIEAALMARRIAPGALRSFAVERWPGVSRAVSLAVRAKLSASALPRAPGVIAGFDRDAGAIVAAESNAERAGVPSDVTLGERAISSLILPEGTPGWIVANPPYGVRVGDAERVRDLWAQLGKVLRERAQGWHVALLSPDQALERQLRLPTRLVAGTTNGGIPVRLIVGEVPE
jgi:putative N6-adenine-specific DNA methylase